MPAFATRCQAIHGTETVDTVAQNRIGQMARDTDGHEWIYLKGVANCGRGSVVVFDHLGTTTLLAPGTMKGPVAVAGNAVPANSFGWFCVEAMNSYVAGVPTRVAPNTLPNAFVGPEGAPGFVGDGRATGDQIRSMMTRAVADDAAARVMASGPSHFWRLDEASSPVLAMDSRGGAHGTLMGGVALGQTGAVSGNAGMLFDGVDDQIVTTANVSIPAVCTIEAWVKIANYPSSSHSFLANRQAPGGALFVGVENDYPFLYGGNYQPGVGGQLIAGQWHHLVYVLTASALTYYVDGVLNSVKAPQLYNGQVLPVSIGFDGGGTGFFVGSVDEIAIYPRALTPYQISEHYRLRTSPSYANAVAADGASHFWRLGESGPQAYDSVGAAHGIISGGVTLGTVGATSGSSAMTFDGTTGKIAVPHAAMQPWGARSLSVEVWAKTSVTPAANTGHFLLDTTSVSTGSLGWFLDLWSDGQVYFDVVYGPTPAEYFSTKAAFPVDGAWHHIVGVLNRETGTLRVWCDGSPGPAITGIPAGVALPFPDDALLQIGQVNSTINPAFKGFNGSLDAVAFYPRALSPAEIQQHYRPDPYAALVVADGAQYYWRLAETSGTVATDLVSGLAGTISGGVTLNQPGAMSGNAAMTFDGATGKITTANVLIPWIVTIEGWIKTTSAAQKCLFSNRNAAGDDAYCGVNTQKLFVYVNSLGAVTGIQTVADGQWHHVAYVFSPTGLSLYVDGVFDQASAPWYVMYLPPVARPALIGTDISTGGFWLGSIDELTIYLRALTADEIRAHYDASTLTRCQFSHPFVDDAYGGAPVLLDAEPTDGPVDEEPACQT